MPNTDFQYEDLRRRDRESRKRQEEQIEAWRKKGLSNPTIGSNPLTGKTQWYGYDANGNRKCWKVDDRGHPVSPEFGIPGLATLAWILVISIVVGAVLVSYGYAQVMVVAAIILLFSVALTVVSPWIGVPFLIVVIIGLVKAVTG